MANPKAKIRMREIERTMARITYINQEKPLVKAVETKREINRLIDANPAADITKLAAMFEDYIRDYNESKIYKTPYIQSLLIEYKELSGLQYRYDFITGDFVF